MDSENPPGGLCTSMSPVSSSTTPSTSATSPAQMKNERGDTVSPRDVAASPRGGDLMAEASTVSPPREITWKSISKERAKLAEKEASALEKTGRKSKEEEVGPSVPTRTVSLFDNMAAQKAAANDGSHLEPETKTVGVTTSHTDGSGMSRLPPRRNTVGSRPIRSIAAPLIPLKSKLAKPKGAPPPLPQASSAIPASSVDQKSGLPITSTKMSFPVPSSSSRSRSYPANRMVAGGRISGEGRNSPKSCKGLLQVRASSSDQKPKKNIKTKTTELPIRATNSTAESKKANPPNPLNHDYAVLEPPSDHDYAILDPEYHEEFYGKGILCICVCFCWFVGLLKELDIWFDLVKFMLM